MRKIYLTFFLLCFISSILQAQDITSGDFVVIDEIVEDYTDLLAQYENEPGIFFITENVPVAIEQITEALSGKTIRDLHIFVATKPGSMVFNSISIVPERVDSFESALSTWKNAVAGKVVVHSEIVFSEEYGRLLKEKLEAATGLTCIMN